MVRGYMVRGLGMAYSCHSDAIVMPYSLVWQSYGKAMGKVWERYGKAMGKVWESYGKGMGKVWEVLGRVPGWRKVIRYILSYIGIA